MGISATFANAILNTARAVPMNAWVPRLALFIGDPLAGGVEVTGGGYVRQNVTFAAPAGNQIANDAAITFPAPTATWGIITHMALMDAMTGGQVRVTYLLGGTDNDRTQQVGSTPVSLTIGSLVLRVPSV